MLPTDCFGQHIIDEAELINVETGGGGSHALIHTKERETYIYGNSKYFHICKLFRKEPSTYQANDNQRHNSQ